MSAEWKWKFVYTAITCRKLCWTSRRFDNLIFPIAIQQILQVPALIALYSTLCHDSLVTRCLLAIINFESYFLVMLGKCTEVGLALNSDGTIFQGLNTHILFLDQIREKLGNLFIHKFLANSSKSQKLSTPFWNKNFTIFKFSIFFLSVYSFFNFFSTQ